ncbi:MAG: HDOD domain-containing protein [Pseudomonadales bacterium]|nr:HDOD domain-containing protein [Pseudomonadales bacterium]
MPEGLSQAGLEECYRELLNTVLSGNTKLPSLPDVTMQVREAIAEENTTSAEITEIIMKDPALTAYLVQTASSPIYRRAVPPKSLSDVVGLLGFSATNSLVMLHTTRNMVELNDANARSIFQHTWDRLVVKASIGAYIAQKTRSMPFDEVQLAMLLSEVGSLTVLSSMLDSSQEIDSEIYFQMCRQYAKHIGGAVLRKWEVDSDFIDVMEKSGQWNEFHDDDFSLLDIANLSIYHTVRMTVDAPTLPEVESIGAFKKLPVEHRRSSKKEGWLDLISDNNDEIQAIISSFK